MYNYLRDHALKNVWCTPEQDNQFIFKPKRITPAGGVLRVHRVMWRDLKTPDNSSHWHYFQLGQVHPLVIGLLPRTDKWISFAESCNAQNMICDIYLAKGIQLPKHNSWYTYTSERDLVIAVKRNDTFGYEFDNDDVYLRLYTNAFFDSIRAQTGPNSIYVQGAKCDDTPSIMALQTAYNVYAAKPGLCMAFVNGARVTAIDLIQMQPGDVGEFVYDSSVRKIADFLVSDLLSFTSTLDSKSKFLLHYAGADFGTIDYRDDIDVYLLDKYNGTRFRAIYFHKNKDDALRQITHRDYSVPVSYLPSMKTVLQNLAANNNRVIDLQNLVIRLQIRKSGYQRSLTNEANRISDLYKMSDVQIVRAMVGVDSVVPNWRAEVLEASDYVKMMGVKSTQLTSALLQSAYGYNAIAKILGDTPRKTTLFSGRQIVDNAYGIQGKSTAYEYDSNGLLLGWYYNINSTKYICNNNNTRLVEIISGFGKRILTDKCGSNNLLVDTTQGYRVYRNNTLTIGVASDWTDVTGTLEYSVVNNRIVRTDGLTTGNFIVRNEKSFLAYDLELMMTDGELRFGLSEDRVTNGNTVGSSLEIPFGHIDVFLNGHSLIQGLDYHVKFPSVAIVNKKFIVNPLTKTQKIHVRMSGFCNSDMEIRKPEDSGFIDHGFLSNNARFNLRDDRVVRIIVDGALKHRDDVVFSEFTTGSGILNASNGKPYSIQETVVPLQWFSTQPDFELRAPALITDQHITDYLTLKIPQPPRVGASAIPERYPLFSPFLSAIIFDLLYNNFNKAPINVAMYTEQTVVASCTPYLHLLSTDPTQQALEMNSNYVIVHPTHLSTVIDLDLYSYRFVERVIKHYIGNAVTLSPFVRVKTP